MGKRKDKEEKKKVRGNDKERDRETIKDIE